MTQPRSGKILSALGLNKARTDLFLGRPYTPKCVLPIKVWITPYKPSISLVLCRCGIRLGCYIHPPLGDSASSLRFAPPSLKRTRGAALIPQCHDPTQTSQDIVRFGP
ncbi:hypothetical protein CUMW_174950 [Citrus unshiu]|uniref:Uncharacterized protein n=1 Tax=Citrus unshiu TaxID=55188 RepID=A0A2H5PWU1_CITUN|nr:hypothetical protein CUMW_174950 [Citrus unshiu]